MIWDDFITFFSFQERATNVIILGTIFLGISSAVVGSFTFLQKKSLIGDSIAHSLLPGIGIGFILAGKNVPILLLCSTATGLLSVYFMDFIQKNTKLKSDTLIALTLTIFFGFGLLILSYIQNSGNAAQSGIDHFLFGKAASILEQDLWTYGLVSGVVLILVIVFFKAFMLVTFNPSFGESLGLPIRFYRFLLTTLTVIVISTGIQIVGVVLMAAMLLTSAGAARYWTHKLKSLIVIAALFGSLSGLFGAFISYTLPQMPTGPWIVVVLSTFLIFSMLFAPKKGVIAVYLKKRQWHEQLRKENVLKRLYHLGETDDDYQKPVGIKTISEDTRIDLRILKRVLTTLTSKGFLIKNNSSWMLTKSGKTEGMRLARIHRLWEMYLTSHLNIAADHVHEDAESIEHIITPELEKELERMLDNPKVDPHGKKIPYPD